MNILISQENCYEKVFPTTFYLMKKKFTGKVCRDWIARWYSIKKFDNKKIKRERKRERGKKTSCDIHPLIFSFWFFPFLRGKKNVENKRKSRLLFKIYRWWIKRYTIYNLAIKLVNMFVSLRLVQYLHMKCVWWAH